MNYGPRDVNGECNAYLYLGDDFGDNVCTIRCQLKPNHVLPHREQFERDDLPVTISWYIDEREENEQNESTPTSSIRTAPEGTPSEA